MHWLTCHSGTLFSELVEKIENVCVNNDLGRLFAVIYVNKEQRKVTTEDLVVINGFFPPQIGDRIRLEKVKQFFEESLKRKKKEKKRHFMSFGLGR